MQRGISFLLPLFLFSPQTFSQPSFLKGGDVSFIAQIEANGGIYSEGGVPGDPFEIFEGNGFNIIRLRVWHTPEDGVNGLQETLAMARRAKDAGLDILLNIHYSDTWADPGRQTKPEAWKSLSIDVLKDSVFSYTKNVLAAFRDQNTMPNIVQIGNEITCGMLWDDGRVCDPFGEWKNLTALVNEGILGVRDAEGVDDTVSIMIHIDRGGDNGGARWFLDNFATYGPDFDIIGLSFYPWWHGTLDDLEENLADLASTYDKDIIVVEVAYPWTLDWYDNTHNIIGLESQLHDGYPATVQGQEAYLADLIRLVRNVPGDRGTGVFYWAPEWISAPTLGSAWENLALFSFEGDLLPSIKAFDSTFTAVSDDNLVPSAFELRQNYPNPFNPTTEIVYTVHRPVFVNLTLFDLLGREVVTLVHERQPPGRYSIEWDAADHPSGVYLYRMKAERSVRTKKLVLLR